MAKKMICKAFGNEDRLRLLVRLVRPRSVSSLLEECTLSQSALSQHLKVLRDARLVESHRLGQQILYRVRDKQALAVAKLLLHYQEHA